MIIDDLREVLLLASGMKYEKKYFLLLDTVREHYDAITNIKSFLGVPGGLCHNCCKVIHNKETMANHVCGENINKKKRKNKNASKMVKELAKYLEKKFTLGSPEELEYLIENSKNPTEKYINEKKNTIFHPKYILYDFECDTTDNLHKPNHVEIIVVKVDDGLTHDYDKCFVERLSFTGYDCVDSFCKWLFHKNNTGATVLAHNAAGYDTKFIHKWCILKRGKRPDKMIRQGSRITYIYFRKFELRFVAS